MIIGYDAKRIFHNYTGLGYYSRTLVNSFPVVDSAFKAILFDHHPLKNDITQSFFNTSCYTISQLKYPAWYTRSFNINSSIQAYPIDLFHGLSNELPFIKLKGAIPSVVTIHDVLFQSFHEDFPWIDRHIYHLKTKSALARADLIVAISKATKADILRHYPEVKEDKIKVIYQSYDPLFDQKVSEESVFQLLKSYHLPAEYILYVGSITHRKNLGILLNAMVLLPKEKRIPLVVAGKGTYYQKRILDYINENKLNRFIHFLPDIPRHQLSQLYHGAQSVIYPSLGEGFGLPVLEALAMNTPVITAGISSMPEAGGALANYFDPLNAEELANCILKINKPRFQQEQAANRQSHLAKFSRTTIAHQYLDEIYSPLIK